MSKRDIARAERIRKEVPMLEVLHAYGYLVRPEMDREQQFACDLHGDGTDNKFSARVYPDSNSMFCFACQKARDPIGLVIEKEGLSFREACRRLEHRYNLPPLPFDTEEWAPRPEDDEIPMAFSRTYEEERDRVERYLLILSREGELPLNLLLGYWEAFDRVQYMVRRERWSKATGKTAMLKVLNRVKERLFEGPHASQTSENDSRNSRLGGTETLESNPCQ